MPWIAGHVICHHEDNLTVWDTQSLHAPAIIYAFRQYSGYNEVGGGQGKGLARVGKRGWDGEVQEGAGGRRSTYTLGTVHTYRHPATYIRGGGGGTYVVG
jgi:hypothetical protein